MTHDDAPLPGLPDVVADTPAATELRRPPEPTTTTGENAGVILGAWIKFVYDSTGIPIPPAVRGRLGKRIKICITTGYTTEQIKWGLAAWLVTRMDDPRLSPNTLDDFVWKYAMDTSAHVQQWRRHIRAELAKVSGGANGNSRRQQRLADNVEQINSWSPADAAR